MAENSRMSKLSEKEDECIFSWKLFTGWDFMIGNTETAHNRIASVTLGFKEALLEEAEKKKDLRNWRIISLRALVNICVVILLAVSAYAVVHVVSRTDDNPKVRSWWRENETTIVVTVISITFPVFFELLGFLEHYHPRKQLRLQLARIMLLNLLNLYSLIFALFSKIEGMSNELNTLKPTLSMNLTMIPENEGYLNESYEQNIPILCVEKIVPCGQCTLDMFPLINNKKNLLTQQTISENTLIRPKEILDKTSNNENSILVANLEENDNFDVDYTLQRELELIKIINNNLTRFYQNYTESNNIDNDDYVFGSPNLEFDSDFNNTSSESSNNTLFRTNFIVTPTTSANTLNYDDFIENKINFDETTKYPAKADDVTMVNTNLYKESEYTNSESIISTEYSYTELMDVSTYKVTEIENYDQTTETQSENDMNRDPVVEQTHVDGKDLYIKVITTDFMTNETNTPYLNTDVLSTISSFFDIGNNETTLDTNLDTTNYPVLNTETPHEMTCTNGTLCPNTSFNCSIMCAGKNITQVFNISNCTYVQRVCYETKCNYQINAKSINKKQANITAIDVVYTDKNNIKRYNLTIRTRKKLLKLCWETMFGQELIKLTMMDLVFVLLGTLFMDFFRALFVRYMNRCWCWDLEKKFPEYGDFKIAENILHLINNQGMVWMGMFFSPGLVVLNVVKLMIMMYLRSWAVMTCNVPHEVVFRVSKSNNFYLALLLTMLFLCVLPVGYTIVWVKPSWHCGPFSEYDRIYYILTNNIYKILPKSLNFALEYIASPAIVIPLLVLLILIIYYLTSLTNSLREANNDLKIQLRRERTEERRKMFQLADTRGRVGSSAMDNTPFARWKKALPSLPLSKSIDSDDRKTITTDENMEPKKKTKKKGGIFAKIVSMALDKKTDATTSTSHVLHNSENTVKDIDLTLPKEIIQIQSTAHAPGNKNNVEFQTNNEFKYIFESHKSPKNELEDIDDIADKNSGVEKRNMDCREKKYADRSKSFKSEEGKQVKILEKINKKQTSESSTQSKQSDSIGSVIPVIMISTTESEEDVQSEAIRKDNKTKEKKHKEYVRGSRAHEECDKSMRRSCSESKSLQRQSSDDSIKSQNLKQMKPEEGHKFQYSL